MHAARRNAGNIVPPYGAANGGEGATIEFAVVVLGVQHIIICGHSHCGAMKGLLHPESLVEQQLRIAQGHPLAFRQEDIQYRGHALECRINAEDPARGFRPCPGLIERFSAPNNARCRVDTHLYGGYRVPSHYDSLIAKVITHGKDRSTAIGQMDVILRTMQIEGIATTVPLHLALLADPAFRDGKVHTQFVENDFVPAYRS